MISGRSRSDVHRNLARIEDGETVIEVVKVSNRQASTKTCRGCKMKQGRTGTVPGQLASGQTLRFDPFSYLHLKYSHNHSRHL